MGSREFWPPKMAAAVLWFRLSQFNVPYPSGLTAALSSRLDSNPTLNTGPLLQLSFAVHPSCFTDMAGPFSTANNRCQ